MSTRLVLAYALRDGVTREDYERWVLEEDAPFVRARPTVERYEVYRVDGALEGEPAMDYLEIVEVTDLAADQALLAQPPGDQLDAAWRSMTRDPMILSISLVAGTEMDERSVGPYR
jgi:hypothetical protein